MPGMPTPAPAGGTSGLISAIASIDLRMAAPMVVPRPVVRVSMALRTASWSVVGGTASCAKPEKSTRPMRVLSSWAATKARTASCAAVSRLGSTSVAHIEPETSTATMTAALATGTCAWTSGAPRRRPISARLARTRATGHVPPPARRGRSRGPDQRDVGVPDRLAASAPQRCQRYAAVRAGTASSRARAHGQAKDMATPPALTGPGTAAPRQAGAPRLPRRRGPSPRAVAPRWTTPSSIAE